MNKKTFKQMKKSNMRVYKLFICMFLSVTVWAGGIMTVQAQEGDQILDGIGETGLIARYMFDGNTKDWSRNNLHAIFHGKKATFVKDVQFGKVLSLPGDSETYVTIPGGALEGVESLSVAGWIYLRSKQLGQRFFDFGKDAKTHFFAAPTGTKSQAGYQALIAADSNGDRGSVSSAVNTEQWVHLVVVINIPEQSLSTYVNGELVAETEDIELDLNEVFGGGPTKSNLFYIGKSMLVEDPYLNAKLHDFRIYRIPLSTKQIDRIYHNNRGDEEDEAEMDEVEDDLPQFDSSNPQLYTEFLKNVPDVEVETIVGHLPRLPRYVKGYYRRGIDGPKVRVLWPAPTDNSAVLKPGRYTVTGQIAGTDFQPKATVMVNASEEPVTPNRKLEAFKLDQVSLRPDSNGYNTKFIENRDKFIKTLATTDPDSFLYMFRNTFGQEQPEGAQPLGVWDSQETKLRGHATGHYMTAIAQAYASTGYDKSLRANFKDKMDYMVNTLYELSQMTGRPREAGGEYVSDPTKVPPGSAKSGYDSDLSEEGIRTDYWKWGEGFISAYPPDQFIMLENGASYGGQKSQVWAPYYTLHKILAGLMDIYEISDNEKALEIAKGMSDWVYARLSKLPTKTLISMWNSYIAGEYGGMNEAMARLYRLTNEAHYLEIAQLFDNIEVFFGDAAHTHGLAKNVDTFRGKHANQHVPQIMGALETYRGSNDSEYYRVADNFWNKATQDYMYSIGGVAGARNPTNAECFIGQPATLYENGFASGGQNETCATYNMLKLTRNLFLYDQRAELMDYYERGLYNHILASVAEDSPANTYHVPLRPGSIKRFGNPHMRGFTCCNGTAIESSTKLQNSIYFKSTDNSALYVNLYVPSTLEWSERDITIEQTTAFPKEDNTRLTIKGGGEFDLNVRVPHWATKGFIVKINGEVKEVEAQPGSYLTLNRKWKDGDIVELRMPFQFHLDPVMDQQNIASLFYGPVLLVAQEPEPRKDWREVTLDAEDISKSIKGDPKKMKFTIDDVIFKPFYETYDRHSVYLDIVLE
ncbi:glycoside hydrolase family 127 protein [Galbibacter sp. EGI 63066]|uniref:beta-L-arabinofuranosidase domain-containing protein n=1 Tax=Galbibacter sp. EGI 63066 TaxID=2993559 RepID=UPI002248E1C6|nr:beta-L-arabinofuranosidase domain-containing protein [Galbibacter sp. EGI 63066]MCX2678631.1 glycoside hydrolase family 127 protein [Galbibacter sp. EGI 63066]